MMPPSSEWHASTWFYLDDVFWISENKDLVEVLTHLMMRCHIYKDNKYVGSIRDNGSNFNWA